MHFQYAFYFWQLFIRITFFLFKWQISNSEALRWYSKSKEDECCYFHCLGNKNVPLIIFVFDYSFFKGFKPE